MSVKLDTYITKENKISKKQYPIIVTDEINIGLLHQVVTSNRTNHRNNTATVKTRAQVSGTGAKPWAQKGTGRARQGSLRSPQFVGGGVAHGPGGRVYKDRTPKKMKRKSLNMALSKRISEGAVFVVDASDMEKPSTKLASLILGEFNIKKSFTFVYGENDDILLKSFRNLEKSNIVSYLKLSTYDVIATDFTIFSESAIHLISGDKK
ncbi:MAG: 50S ribosomal protein L4 [Actinomycetota bacterium]|nr:50S ribosomal protein L4 [Actinomycetota bacterium]